MSDKWTKPSSQEAQEMEDAMQEQARHQKEVADFKRKSERVMLEAQVTVTSETNFFTGLTENISEGGIFITSLAPPDVGTNVDVAIGTGEGSPPINLACVVTWIRTEDGSPVGCGCRFLSVDDVTAARLRDLLQRGGREPLFYDV